MERLEAALNHCQRIDVKNRYLILQKHKMLKEAINTVDSE